MIYCTRRPHISPFSDYILLLFLLCIYFFGVGCGVLEESHITDVARYLPCISYLHFIPLDNPLRIPSIFLSIESIPHSPSFPAPQPRPFATLWPCPATFRLCLRP